MRSIAVIGDVHGCFKTLQCLLKKLQNSHPGAEPVFVGDLIDRGPRSCQVVSYIKETGYPCVMGNHEDMMVRDCKIINGELQIDAYHSVFLMNGGKITLDSYRDENGELYQDFEEHLKWMKKLPLYIEFKDVIDSKGQYLIISHSSLANVWKLRNATDPIVKSHFIEECIWTRNLKPIQIPGAFNVFGHTPLKNGPLVKSHFANVDTGACFVDQTDEGGILTALVFPEMDVISVKNCD